jgi:hypothetical protein
LRPEAALDTLFDEATKGWRRRDLVQAFVDLCERCNFPAEVAGRFGMRGSTRT